MPWTLRDALATARLKIRAVRYKNGGELRVLTPEREVVSEDLRCELYDMIDDFWDGNIIAGYALVLWDVNGDTHTSTTNAHTSRLPGGVLPDLVKECVRRMRTKTMIDQAFGHDDEAS
jgi:hypothetical protein